MTTALDEAESRAEVMTAEVVALIAEINAIRPREAV